MFDPLATRLARVKASAVLVLLIALAGCGSIEVDPGVSPAVSVPIEELPGDTRCLVEHGWTIVKVLPAVVPGDQPGYKLTSDKSLAEQAAEIDVCQEFAPRVMPRSDDELRAIFQRWVTQRQCLIALGYRPASPPSFEVFASEWRSSEPPWMPIDGVAVERWSEADYREAKDRCVLEMYSRE